MATRALIGIIETDAAGNQVLTSTYNHYDGYPDNLGVGLNKHYDEVQSAKQIANQGYISYLDPETGAIDAKHKESADKFVLPDDFEEAMQVVHNEADEMGADYVYLYDFDAADWLDARNSTQDMINKFRGSGVADQFRGGIGPDSYEDDPDNPLGIPVGEIKNKKDMMGENYKEKWNKFITENQAIDNQWTAYVKSLVNDIRLNGAGAYTEYTEDDFQEDFDNYIGDKMGM